MRCELDSKTDQILVSDFVQLIHFYLTLVLGGRGGKVREGKRRIKERER